jgi:hypothetical protein
LCGFDEDLAVLIAQTSNRIRSLLTQIHPALERVLGPRLDHLAIAVRPICLANQRLNIDDEALVATARCARTCSGVILPWRRPIWPMTKFPIAASSSSE